MKRTIDIKSGHVIMKKGSVQNVIIPINLKIVRRPIDIVENVEMRNHDSFGFSGRTGRIENIGSVFVNV
jgi:hypothetical protein